MPWNRLGIASHLGRFGFFTVLFFLCGWPMLFNVLFASAKSSIRWPLYVPPYIAVLNDWMKLKEITATDMPWAIAWYADRRAVWLPDTVHADTEFSDYRVFGSRISGLYRTPISGS